MGGQKSVRVCPSVPTDRTVNKVISKSKSIRPSTITVVVSTRPEDWAYAQALAASSRASIIDWPLPDEDITGLTKTGRPMRCAASA